MSGRKEQLPREFGKYHLIERIATGGMAELYRAKLYGAGGFEKDLAVKKILPHLGSDEAFVQMFMDEAMITVTLNHGNIAQVLDFGELDGEYFLVMEYVDGIDLQALIKRSAENYEPTPAALAAHIVAEICLGLEYAHNKLGPDGQPLQIIHRDVSPQNVLISFEGQVKLVDFGIARAASRITSTQAGVIKGKVAYMSPEQLIGQTVDARSDVFAVGIILYELLTHRRPFDGATPQETMALLTRGVYQPPQKLNRQVDRKLARLVKKALEKNVKKRYQTAGTMAAELASYLHNTGEPPTSMSLAQLVRERLPEAKPRTMQPTPIRAMRHDTTPGIRPARAGATSGTAPEKKITAPNFPVAAPDRQEAPAASPDHEERRPADGSEAVSFGALGLPGEYMVEILDSQLQTSPELPEPDAAPGKQQETPEPEADQELLTAATKLLTQTKIDQQEVQEAIGSADAGDDDLLTAPTRLLSSEEVTGEREPVLPDAEAPTEDFEDEAPGLPRKKGHGALVTAMLVVAAAAVVFFVFVNPFEKESTDQTDRVASADLASVDPIEPPPVANKPPDRPDPDEPIDNPMAKPVDKPDAQPDLVPVTKPVDKPADKPVARPGKKPGKKPGMSVALRPRGTGTLKINSEPFSVVFWGKKRIGPTPQMNVKLPAGSHTLLLKNEALGIQKRVRVHIEANKVRTVFVELKKK